MTTFDREEILSLERYWRTCQATRTAAVLTAMLARIDELEAALTSLPAPADGLKATNWTNWGEKMREEPDPKVRVPLTLRMPSSLSRRLAARAKELGVSLNELISAHLQAELKKP